MIEIRITDEMLTEAKANVTKYNDYNLFGGAYTQKLAGEIGRLALRQHLMRNSIAFSEDTNIGSKDEFDFIIGGKNISLKTQLCNHKPQNHWRCEVTEKQLNNECDYHLFIKTNLNVCKVWIVGCIKKEIFDIIGVYRQQGEVLDDNLKEWNVKVTKKDVLIDQLSSIEDLF